MTYRPEPDTESATGRRTTEIEITPEMIEAGCMALYARGNDPKWTADEDRVTAIFRAMIAAR